MDSHTNASALSGEHIRHILRLLQNKRTTERATLSLPWASGQRSTEQHTTTQATVPTVDAPAALTRARGTRLRTPRTQPRPLTANVVSRRWHGVLPGVPVPWARPAWVDRQASDPAIRVVRHSGARTPCLHRQPPACHAHENGAARSVRVARSPPPGAPVHTLRIEPKSTGPWRSPPPSHDSDSDVVERNVKRSSATVPPRCCDCSAHRRAVAHGCAPSHSLRWRQSQRGDPSPRRLQGVSSTYLAAPDAASSRPPTARGQTCTSSSRLQCLHCR